MTSDKNNKTSEEEKLEKMRHSASHVMAEAVQSIFPTAKFAIGPAIENGFYYDFDLPRPLTPDDLPVIEAKMGEIIASNTAFVREEVTREKALKMFAAQPYKLELINDLPDEKMSIYKQGSFIDLCRGPHVNSTKEIPKGAFKLDKIAGAYWRGSEKNKMLQRIYGLLFSSKKELDEYLALQEEIKKRDHRKIGKDLDLFVFSDLVGKGLPLFTEKGSIIRRTLERFIVDEELRRGYKHVYTPDLANLALYKTSGHYPYYKDTMYPVMKVDEEELMLRPMSCPHHFELYASRPRSYKELPYRIAELVKQFRYEKSGELTGLMRLRSFCLADSHIICQPDQAMSEINGALDLIEYVSATLGLDNCQYRLSLGDREDSTKYYKDDETWDFAEGVLRQVLTQRKANFFEAGKEAAFYGPKIDIQMRNFAGKEDTVFTVQYDFLGAKRFKLTYIDSDQKEKEPIVIHRSSIGAIERTMAFLIEHYAGAFPVWLAPVQVAVIPVADRHNEYANKVEAELKKKDIRVKVDDRSERMNLKIRQAQLEKIPYMVVLGDKEVETASVAVRLRSGEQLPAQSLESFIESVSRLIASRSKDLV
ncbi:MAG: threonine--tRNA ligase [Chloroflexi bacterium RBG_16_51_9]|nr:MAG: threonine--tRNA ligase [Chloroflexi bacterium RBG_16_51_9]